MILVYVRDLPDVEVGDGRDVVLLAVAGCAEAFLATWGREWADWELDGPPMEPWPVGLEGAGGWAGGGRMEASRDACPNHPGPAEL